VNSRRGLGRGLGALIPTAPSPGPLPAADPFVRPSSGPFGPVRSAAAQVPAQSADDVGDNRHLSAADDPATAGGPGEAVGAHFAELPVTAIRPNPKQPRREFDADALAELVASISVVGLLQPVVVRQVDGGPVDGVGYELVMGERRWRAAQAAGMDLIPAIVRDTADEAMLRDALLENLHRAQLNPLEEAAAYQQMLDDFGCTHEELATRIGRSRPQITNTLRLLRLTPPVQRRVAAGVLTAGHARALVTVENPDVQDRLAHRVVAEQLSVRALEELVATGAGVPDLGPARRTPAALPHQPELTAVAQRLSERYDTRVKVELGRRKGRISVEFASLDDLHRLAELLDPPRITP
jgi:ParB family chromosome partitioning protein